MICPDSMAFFWGNWSTTLVGGLGDVLNPIQKNEFEPSVLGVKNMVTSSNRSKIHIIQTCVYDTYPESPESHRCL